MARLCFLVWIAAVCLAPSWRAEAHYRKPELEEIPIDRLLTNLQGRLELNPNSWNVHYQLGRLHSMAYASNANVFLVEKENGDFYDIPFSTQVPEGRLASTNREAEAKSHLTSAITHYARSLALIGNPTMKQDSFWKQLPANLGLAWCLDESGRREEAISAYRKTLKLALIYEVGRDYQKMEWIKENYDAPGTRATPVRTNWPGDMVTRQFNEESIRYLLKLLDPVKDASEIASLNKAQVTLDSLMRGYTPIIIPLTHQNRLSDLVSTNTVVPFDLDGSGIQRRWGWITPKAAWLVSDPHRTGQITSGLQLFGNVTFWIFWRDGYEALASLDNNNDGVLKGSELEGLALWQDVNSNGVSEPGEVWSLVEFGITALRCRSQIESAQGPWHPQGVEFDDGRTAPTYDWISPETAR